VLRAGSSEKIDVTTVKLSEVLSALSFVLDMVEGQPEGHVLRSCFIGMTIAERLQLSEEQRSALLLRPAPEGCRLLEQYLEGDGPLRRRRLRRQEKPQDGRLEPVVPDGSVRRT
jgi:hypothetical protein